MTPESARMVLRKKMRPELWIDSELLGASKRRKAKYEAEKARLKADEQLEREEIQRLIELPDKDLQWLLDNGWSPR